MDPAEIQKRLQAKFGVTDGNRLGGKGTPRRKRKAVHKVASGDDKKLQAALKKLGAQPVPGIDAFEIVFADKVVHFASPKVQAVMDAKMFAVSGTAQTRQAASEAPGFDQAEFLRSLTPQQLEQFQRMLAQSRAGGAAGAAGAGADDDDIPDLVENFESAAAVAEPAAAATATATAAAQ
jgi:nascent polypeptide-associated complex subunit beta